MEIFTPECGQYHSVWYNGVRKTYVNKIETTKAPEVNLWCQYGLCTNSGGPIVNFLVKNLPNDTALIIYQSDFVVDMPKNINKCFKKYLLISYFAAGPNTILISGDDKFFENPDFYLPDTVIPFENKIHDVFWRGECTGAVRRQVVFELNNFPGCDVKLVSGSDLYGATDWWRSIPKECFSERVYKDEYSKHTIWLSIEGFGIASDYARCLMSGSAVIYFRLRKPWFDSYLKHEENCIIIENDIEQLKFYINKLLNDKELTRKIAENGKELSTRIFKKEVYEKFMLDQLKNC